MVFWCRIFHNFQKDSLQTAENKISELKNISWQDNFVSYKEETKNGQQQYHDFFLSTKSLVLNLTELVGVLP